MVVWFKKSSMNPTDPHPNPLRPHPMGAEREEQANAIGHLKSPIGCGRFMGSMRESFG